MSTDNTLPAVASSRSLPAVSTPTSDRTASVLALLQNGIAQGMTPEALGQLASLYERVMAKDAEAQFLEAKRAFQAECPVIGKNRDVDMKTKEGKQGAKYRFADLEKIVQTIRPLLERHGFSYDFAQDYQGSIVSVTCFLRHAAGHVEATKFSGPWETSASMSAIQKSASATTFCQRYALRLALGLPVGEDDDAPPDPYQNPDERPDAPKVAPRGQRKPEPSQDPLLQPITQDEFKGTFDEWRGVYLPDEKDDKAAFSAFAKWAFDLIPDQWNPRKREEWNQGRLKTAWTKLPGGGEGE